MAKKAELFATAEAMFVQQFATVAAIAEQLGIAEKTVRNWKAEGNWDAKRQELLKRSGSIADEMYELGMNLLALAKKDVAEGREPSRHILTFIVQCGRGAEQAKRFEEASKPIEEDVKPVTAITEESLAATKKKLGL
jgi:uncharacterized protein YjcR